MSQPTFTGNALATHDHTAGTIATSAHAGSAVGNHAVTQPSAHSNHAVTQPSAHSNHTVTQPNNHTDVVNHVHVQSVNSATAGGLSGYTPDTSTNTSVSSGYSTANPTSIGVAAQVHAGTNVDAHSAHTGTAVDAHAVTQPSAHTISGSVAATSAGTPAGTVSQPTFTGSPTSVVQPYFVVYMWKRTA